MSVSSVLRTKWRTKSRLARIASRPRHSCPDNDNDGHGELDARGHAMACFRGTRDFARSRRPASVARCTGSSGGFASYRRDPLLGT